MTAGNGEGTSNTMLCIVRWIWNWLFKARQKREGQPSITQSAHGLKTEGANSPNIIANTFNYNNYHTTPVPQQKSVLKQVWHDPKTQDGSIAPLRAESTETIKSPDP